MKAIFKTYGGKNKQAAWICRHLPSPLFASTYVEPFCRAASVFFHLESTHSENVLNDIDTHVINFLNTIKNHPNQLIEKIQNTPYDQKTFCDAVTSQTKDNVEMAVNFYVECQQGRGARAGTNGPTAWQKPRKNRDYAAEWSQTEHLLQLSKKLQVATLANLNAFDLIPQHNNPQTVMYVDPPYMPQTRSKRWSTRAYLHEMTVQEHKKLAEILNASSAFVIISHTDCSEYDNLYRNWNKYRHTPTSREVIYKNY